MSAKRRIAVKRARIVLTPETTPWSWAARRKLEIEVDGGNAPITVGGAPALWKQDIIEAIKIDVPKQMYKCVDGATPGTIGSVQVNVDEDSLTSGILAKGDPLVTSDTRGRFAITAAAPSIMPDSKPDPIGFHSGTWRVEDPAQNCLNELASKSLSGGDHPVAPFAQESTVKEESGENGSKKNRRKGFILGFMAAIENGPMIGIKGDHRVSVDFSKPGEEVVSLAKSFWSDTDFCGLSIGRFYLVPPAQDIEPAKEHFKCNFDSSLDRVVVNVTASGATGLGKYIASSRAGGILAAKIGRIVGGQMGSLVAWYSREKVAQWLTPAIDYEFKIFLKADGTGRITGWHNKFPTYSVFLYDETREICRMLYNKPHVLEEANWGCIDFRPMKLLSDLKWKMIENISLPYVKDLPYVKEIVEDIVNYNVVNVDRKF